MIDKIDGGQGMTLKNSIIENEFEVVEIPEKREKQTLNQEEKVLYDLVLSVE